METHALCDFLRWDHSQNCKEVAKEMRNITVMIWFCPHFIFYFPYLLCHMTFCHLISHLTLVT